MRVYVHAPKYVCPRIEEFVTHYKTVCCVIIQSKMSVAKYWLSSMRCALKIMPAILFLVSLNFIRKTLENQPHLKDSRKNLDGSC